MAERSKGRGSPPRMASNDSSPIPIYSLSLMLLKNPTHSANREGTLSGEGGGGRRELETEERGSTEVMLGALKPGVEAQWGPMSVPDRPSLLSPGIGASQFRIRGRRLYNCKGLCLEEHKEMNHDLDAPPN